MNADFCKLLKCCIVLGKSPPGHKSLSTVTLSVKDANPLPPKPQDDATRECRIWKAPLIRARQFEVDPIQCFELIFPVKHSFNDHHRK